MVVKTAIKLTAWFLKFGLVVLGLYLLLIPGYALYLRAIGLIVALIGVFTFNTMQARLLSERGIRIPNWAVAILLVVGLVTVVVVSPGASDMQLSNEQVESNGETSAFSMDVTNTGDGPTIGDVYFTVEVRVDDETVSQTQLEGMEFDRGETRTVTADLSLEGVSESVRDRIRNGDYEIAVSIADSEDSESPRVERYSPSDL
jgi:hypothetical protein